MRLARAFGLVVCFGGLFSLTGCGGNKPLPKELGPLFPVQGKVSLDGKLLRGGNVTFFALDHDVKICQPEGLIDSDGNYTVSSYGQNGAPAGKYRVTVLPGSNDKSIDLAVDDVYQSWENSPLTVTVTENPPAGAYDLKLKKSPSKR
jgi:hypothetical protein